MRQGTRQAEDTWIADDWDDLNDEALAALHKAIREGFAEAKAGKTIVLEECIAELRSRL